MAHSDPERGPAAAPKRHPAGGVPLTFALPGGGSRRAFAWGVLDRLLDTPASRVEAVSGTSAGAVNAAFLVQGLATGRRAEAKRPLGAFWRRVAVVSGSPGSAAACWLFPFAGAMAPLVDPCAAPAAPSRAAKSTRSAPTRWPRP